jgi:nucleoside-diphosphate-sugar epimerase
LQFFKKKNYFIEKFDIEDHKKYDLRKNNLLLEKKIKKCNYVFFLAFDVGGSRYLKAYQESYNFLMNNLKIMKVVFNSLAKSRKPFLFASSQMSNMTYSNYGLLKLLGERITAKLNGNFVKFWNVYGIERNLKKSHVITDFILMALKNRKIKMLTNGKETRKFLYAEDCSEGLEIIMRNHYKFKSSNNELHLTSNKNISIIEIAKVIKKIAQSKNINVEILQGKNADTVQLNKKNKNNNFLNKYWKPKNSIKKGILEIFEYYQKSLK